MERETEDMIGSIYRDGGRLEVVRVGDWRHGGNIPRHLSTINIFLICALLLTSKITSK